MSKNKENIPLNSQRRNGSFSSPAKLLTSDEFFTDSLLDATRLSSRIPSPSPQKQTLAKARRARTSRNTRNTHHSSQGLPAIGTVLPQPRQKSILPETPLREGSNRQRARTNSLTTPPGSGGSGGELPLASPYLSVTSPPPQDLTDSYRQIEDAEELAQTEREVSSNESNQSDEEVNKAFPVRFIHRSKSESPYKAPAAVALSSAASTPTRSVTGATKDRRFNDRVETWSEASGLSFLKDMTDQGLAAKLTPHVSESARDKQRLKEIWDQKPIAFSKAQAPPRLETRTASSIPVPRVTAFSKASKPLPNGIANGAGYDLPDRPASQQSGMGSQYSHDSLKQDDRPIKTLPTNPNAQRTFNFSTHFGFPQHRAALTEKNLEQQNRGGPHLNQALQSQSSAPSLLSGQSANNARVLDEGIPVTNGHSSRLPQFRRSAQSVQKPEHEESSKIDWATAAADVPLPSVESSFSSEKKDATPTTLSRNFSPEKSRRWDNDFTGQSFQVSESPVVRQKPAVYEEQRGKEIKGVAKQAVTTNRLSEIRERQSQESLRNASKSPAPRSISRSSDPKLPPAISEDDVSEVVAEPVPDTPVVIYRSSSNSGSDKASTTPSSSRQGADGSKSHDHLQRLARAMSTTPRSSPVSASDFKDIEKKAPSASYEKQEDDAEASKKPAHVGTQEETEVKPPPVAQTPKVVGGWTDTILPDTVKTIKQTAQKLGYAQTPHVSAGGWVDTPAPVPIEQRKCSGNIATIIEEVPEELTSGFAKDNASSDTVKVEVADDLKVMAVSEPQQPKSALASILDKQKNRLVSQDVTGATRDDTLNLGNDTIESLQGLLALDEHDFTTLSRLSFLEDDTKPLGDIQAESELLERLGVKLDRLRNNIHDARKGISKLEHQVSNPVEHLVQTTPQILLNDTTCNVCNQQSFQPHLHHGTKYLPYTSLNLSLPIPILFKPRRANEWLPRPTLLGSIVLTIWAWYLIESTMCELYCRPAYTDFYEWPAQPEPEFPFVLPTMLARWTRLNNMALGSLIVSIWGIITGLTRATWRILSMTLGWSDGFAADEPASHVMKKAVETTTRLAAAASGVDMSMNDDEYL